MISYLIYYKVYKTYIYTCINEFRRNTTIGECWQSLAYVNTKKNKFVKYADKPTTYDECWYPQTVMGEYWQHSKCYVCNALIIQSHVNRDKAHRTYTDFENICPFTLKFNNASTYM